MFKPSFNGSKIVTSEFEHFKEFDEKVYTKRAGPGQVLLNPPNFLTNPLKKGKAWCYPGVCIEKGFKYDIDEYDAKKLMT